MIFYSAGDIERALKIMYPTESILHRQTMYRYFDKEDCISEQYKKFELCKGKKNYYFTKEGITLMVKDFNVGKRKEIDLDILLDYVDRIASGEEINIENDVKTIYQKLKDAEKELQAKEEELKRKTDMIEKLKVRINDFEESNTRLLTDGKKKEEEYEKKINRQADYLKDLDTYQTDKEKFDKINKIKKWWNKLEPPVKPKLEDYI